jgi:nucleoside-diphosphate-sugar epimerase
MDPHDGRVVTNFIRQALEAKPLTVYGDGGQTRSFQYVDDLIEAIVRLLSTTHPGPINLGNPDEFTVLELAQLVLELTGSQSPIVFEPLPADDPRRRRPEISLARELLGWQPRVPLRDGLALTIDHFRRSA